MELTTRQIVAEDYDKILVDWWIAWGWKPPVRDFLPNNGTGGIIVYDGETPVCAGFVYVTNSKVCWVDWVISNKDYKKKKARKEALKLLISNLTQACGKEYNYCYALIKNESLIKIYEEEGYIRGDQYTSEMIKVF